MCRKGGNCNREICFFAPSTKEMRTPSKPRPMAPQDPSAEAVAAYSALITGGTSQVAGTPAIVSLEIPSTSTLEVPLSLPLSELSGTAGHTSMGPPVSLSGPSLDLPMPDKQMHSVPMILERPLGSVALAQPRQQLVVQRGSQLVPNQQFLMSQQQAVVPGQQHLQATGQQVMLPGQQQLQVPGQRVMSPGQQQLQAPGQHQLQATGQRLVLPRQQHLQAPGQQMVSPGQQVVIPGQQQLQTLGRHVVLPGQQLQMPGQQVMLSTQQQALPCKQQQFPPVLPMGVSAAGNSGTKPPSSSGSFNSIGSGTGRGTSTTARWPVAAAQQDLLLPPASTATAAAGPSSLLRWQLQAALQGMHLPATAPPAAGCSEAANAYGSNAYAAQAVATDVLIPSCTMQQLLPSAAAGTTHVGAIYPLGFSTIGAPITSSGSAGITGAGDMALVRDLSGVNHMFSGLSIGPVAQAVALSATQQHLTQAQVHHHQLRHQTQQLDDSAMNLCTVPMVMHSSSTAALQSGMLPASSWVVKSTPGDAMYWQQTVPVSRAVIDSGSTLHGHVSHPTTGLNQQQPYSNDWCVSGFGP